MLNISITYIIGGLRMRKRIRITKLRFFSRLWESDVKLLARAAKLPHDEHLAHRKRGKFVEDDNIMHVIKLRVVKPIYDLAW